MNAMATELGIGAALDLAFGDPHWLPHPVQGIGILVRTLERILHRMSSTRWSGALLVILTLLITVTISDVTLRWGGVPVAVYWIFSCIALRSLDQHAVHVIEALRRGDIKAAQQRVGFIVGRDTANLSSPEIVRAVFETVAENMSDGIVAPLCFLAAFGVPGMVAYKAVNTMDSMIGYKNDRYLHFGWAAARLDDICNYIPARLTAGLIVVTSALLNLRWQQALTVTLRDARFQPSPNAGYPEAALAGALGVQLGGLNYYFGRPVHKPHLGDPIDELQWNRFPSVRCLMYSVALFSYLLVGLWLYTR
jgi:adenosylcobinamide-phosphate synthase